MSMYSKKIRIQFVDTDASDRIHYTAVFRFFELLDHEFFRSIGYSYKELFAQGYEMPRIHVDCSYLGSVFYDDELDAQVEIINIGNSSFTYQFQFFKEEQLVVKGSLKVVFITAANGKTITIPVTIRNELERHLVQETIQ